MYMADRIFCSWIVWRKEFDNSFVVAWIPLQNYAQEEAEAFEQVKNRMAKQVRGERNTRENHA